MENYWGIGGIEAVGDGRAGEKDSVRIFHHALRIHLHRVQSFLHRARIFLHRIWIPSHAA